MATYQSQVLDHLGLVAGMFNELGIREVIDRTIPQDMTKRTVSLGQAVKAMVLNGLGFVNQQLYLVPSFFQNKPTERLVGPGITAAHLNDDVLGRALDALYSTGVTSLYSLIATEAATRLGVLAQYAHLDTTSFHVDGRYNSAEEPDATVIHITQGYSREHRPDLNQVMLELIWADSAYRGDTLATWCAREGAWRVEIITRVPHVQRFVLRPWCWIVERTLGWMGRQRRLSKDYERKVQTSEILLQLAMIRLIVRRLARSPA